MMFQRYLLVALTLGALFSAKSMASQSAAIRACALLKTSYYTPEEKEDIQFFCQLPEQTRNALQDHYWLKAKDYEALFLKRQPKTPQARKNVTAQGDDNVYVNKILNHPHTCQFYSSISPSVQSKRVSESTRLRIVGGAEELLQECEDLDKKIRRGETPLCSVIELAGHSTQSAGLDTVIGIDYVYGHRKMTPEYGLMKEIAACFHQILVENSGVVFSTCGGEKSSRGQYHYWVGKTQAQQELADLLDLPIISGIGPVHFASKHGPNGTESNDGWTISFPRK